MHGGHHHPWRALRSLFEWTLHWRDLPEGVLGVTDHRRRTITLTTGMTQAERRSTIAHEVTHAERGPVPRHLAAREERIVDHQLADELWVDVGMVRARLAGLTDAETVEVNRRLDDAEVRMP